MQYPSLKTLTSDTEEFSENDNHLWYFEEKYDGSQLSWRVENGKLVFFNKEKAYKGGTVFGPAIDSITLKFSNNMGLLNIDYTYHGECFSKPKHNVIAYTRAPLHFWICYDIYDQSTGKYLSRDEKEKECSKIGLECSKLVYQNQDRSVNPYTKAKEYIDKFETGEIRSYLGGDVEGVVLKHHQFLRRGEIVSRKRKFTTSDFQEKQKKGTRKIKQAQATANEFIDAIGEAYNVKGRFAKAVIHLKEADRWDYQCSEANIPALKDELDKDFDKECKRDVREYLGSRFMSEIAGRWDKPETKSKNKNEAKIEEEHETEIQPIEKEDYSLLDETIGKPTDMTSTAVIRKFYREQGEKIKDFLWEKYEKSIKEKARSSLEMNLPLLI